MEYLRLCSLIVLWIMLIDASHSSRLSDVRYYGCFDDKGSYRALGTYIGYPYTIEECIAQCRQSLKGRSTFAGLQNYDECWCGENYDRYGITYKCYDGSLQPCREDRSNVCGAGYTNSVFKVCPGSRHGLNCEYNNPACGNRGADVNGQCLSTCPPGFRGAECDEACPEGSFGPGCEGNCTSRCVNNSCDPRLGYCLQGCKTGWGPFCLLTCQDPRSTPTGPCPFCGHCKDAVCAGSGGDCYYQCPRNWEGAVCQACPSGKWGARCEHDCHVNCPDTCNKDTGHCGLCSTGTFGDHCEKTCSSTCPSSCDKTSGYCDFCSTGYYGNNCEKSCPSRCGNSDCDRYSGHCLKCDGEYYGYTCEKTCGKCYQYGCGFPNGECWSCEKGFYTTLCNERCPVGCTSDGCDMSTGDCIACKPGLYGPKCENNCTDGCEKECDWKSGVCDSCVSGKYGSYCNMTCGQCPGGHCNQNNGHCSPCVDGYFGEKCNFTCPNNCNNSSCDQDSGMCYSCVSGYYGPVCDVSCGECSFGKCDYGNGACTPCKPGYFEPTCNTQCNETCPDAGCDQVSGECIGCSNGWYGDTCSLSCPVNCVTRVCDQTSGECTLGCISSFYGPLCDQECFGCLGGVCDTHGVCVDGCVDGKTGALCNEACPPGTFGSNCSMECHCADGVACDPVSGRCDVGGCEEGWTGDDCQAKALQAGVDVVAIAAPAAVGILVIIVIITVVIVMLVRRKRTKKVDENPNLENINDAYAEISNEDQPKSNPSTGYGPYEEVDIPTVAEDVFYENAQELKYQSLIGTYTNSNNHNLENIDNAYAVISNDDQPKSNQSTGDEPYEEVDIPTVAEGVFYENTQELKDRSPIDTSNNTNNTITKTTK